MVVVVVIVGEMYYSFPGVSLSVCLSVRWPVSVEWQKWPDILWGKTTFSLFFSFLWNCLILFLCLFFQFFFFLSFFCSFFSVSISSNGNWLLLILVEVLEIRWCHKLQQLNISCWDEPRWAITNLSSPPIRILPVSDVEYVTFPKTELIISSTSKVIWCPRSHLLVKQK